MFLLLDKLLAPNGFESSSVRLSVKKETFFWEVKKLRSVLKHSCNESLGLARALVDGLRSLGRRSL